MAGLKWYVVESVLVRVARTGEDYVCERERMGEGCFRGLVTPRASSVHSA